MIDDTHDPSHVSWVEGAEPGSDFPVLLSLETYERTFSWIKEVDIPSADIEQILQRTAPTVLRLGP